MLTGRETLAAVHVRRAALGWTVDGHRSGQDVVLAAAQALSVDAAGGVITGFGAPGSLGRPLPGTSVAIDDADEVHVRSAAVPAQAPGRRDDGWLPTGLRGELVEGSLVLDSHREPAPAAGAA